MGTCNHVAPGHAALRRGRASIPHHIYHVTVVTRGREKVFEDFDAACATARCLEDRQCLRTSIMLAWVLMPDHAHWLLRLGSGDTLAGLVTRLKCSSARHANQVLGRRGALWNPAFHDHAMRDDEDMRATARYLVANPLRAGLVCQLGDYPFWNAVWLPELTDSGAHLL